MSEKREKTSEDMLSEIFDQLADAKDLIDKDKLKQAKAKITRV